MTGESTDPARNACNSFKSIQNVSLANVNSAQAAIILIAYDDFQRLCCLMQAVADGVLLSNVHRKKGLADAKI